MAPLVVFSYIRCFLVFKVISFSFSFLFSFGIRPIAYFEIFLAYCFFQEDGFMPRHQTSQFKAYLEIMLDGVTFDGRSDPATDPHGTMVGRCFACACGCGPSKRGDGNITTRMRAGANVADIFKFFESKAKRKRSLRQRVAEGLV